MRGILAPSRGGDELSAKHKLNGANLLGILLIAGLMGGITGSWTVFWITGAALFASAVHSGDIRR